MSSVAQHNTYTRFAVQQEKNNSPTDKLAFVLYCIHN